MPRHLIFKETFPLEGHKTEATGQVPARWYASYAIGKNNRADGTPAQDWTKPETRIMTDAFLPVHEHSKYLNENNSVYKIFKTYRAFNFILSHSLNWEERSYEVVVDYYDDSKHHALMEEDGVQVGVRMGNNVDYKWENSIPQHDNLKTFAFNAGGILNVAFRSIWGIDHGCFFVRSISVYLVDDLPQDEPNEPDYPDMPGNGMVGVFIQPPLTDIQLEAMASLSGTGAQVIYLAPTSDTTIDTAPTTPNKSGGGGGGVHYG